MDLCHVFADDLQVLVVGTRHVCESHAKVRIVFTQQRIGQQVDVVCDDHQIPYFQFRIDAAGRVRHKERFCPHQLEHPYGKGHLVHAVPFVIMKASLHANDVFAAQGTGNQIALVAGSRREQEMGNVFIGDGYFVFYTVGQLAQSAAQNNGHLRAVGNSFQQIICRFLVKSRVHFFFRFL